MAAWGIPLLLGSTYLGGIWFALLIAVISLLAIDEYYRLMVKTGRRPMRLLGLLVTAAIIFGWVTGEVLIWILALSFLLFAIIGTILHRSHLDILIGFGGVCYIPLLAGTFILVRDWNGLADVSVNDGRWLAFCVWGAIWIGDTAAYAGGKRFGKHPLASRLSPNKTIEGAVFGFAGAVLFGLICSFTDFVRLDTGLAIGIAAGLFGQIGDLFESAIKREAGVKDTSSLLPGHGGILDRFDSLIATVPIVALYLKLFG